MRCKNQDCLRVMKNPSDKTKETGLCSNCRKAIEKKSKTIPKIIIKVKPKSKAPKSAVELFEDHVGGNKEYEDFCKMFHKKESVNVQSM